MTPQEKNEAQLAIYVEALKAANSEDRLEREVAREREIALADERVGRCLRAAWDAVQASRVEESKKLYVDRVRDFERKLIKDALLKTNGNQCQAAKLLNLGRTTLVAKMDALDIPKFRSTAAGRE